jgi:hypothetical protein
MYKVVNTSAEGVGLVIELSIHSGHYAKSKQEITKHSVAEILLYISVKNNKLIMRSIQDIGRITLGVPKQACCYTMPIV